MVDNKYQVFVKEGCSKCQEIVDFMKSSNLNTQIIDVSTKEGFILSQKNKILKLPTVIMLDKKNNVIDLVYTLKEFQENNIKN